MLPLPLLELLSNLLLLLLLSPRLILPAAGMMGIPEDKDRPNPNPNPRPLELLVLPREPNLLGLFSTLSIKKLLLLGSTRVLLLGSTRERNFLEFDACLEKLLLSASSEVERSLDESLEFIEEIAALELMEL